VESHAGRQIGYWIGRSAGAALYAARTLSSSVAISSALMISMKNMAPCRHPRALHPIIRRFCPPVAGAAKMPYVRYVAFDICGGFCGSAR